MAKKIKVEKTVSVDTTAVDTTAVDTTAVDTTAVDTTAVDTTAVDTTAVLTKQEINECIDKSFYGSLSTQKLINHFSAITTDSACMDNYYVHCYAEKGWKKQGDILDKRKGSKAPAGHQAVQKWACMILLSELSLWDDSLTTAKRNKLVRDNWNALRNVVAMRCFKNASVANAMCSMRSDKKGKEEKAKVELQDQVEDTAEEVVEKAVREESMSGKESLELVVEKLKNIKDITEIVAIIKDIESIISTIK